MINFALKNEVCDMVLFTNLEPLTAVLFKDTEDNSRSVGTGFKIHRSKCDVLSCFDKGYPMSQNYPTFNQPGVSTNNASDKK